ncbi:MAG: protein BatD [Gammaproteobacteria bacterium]|nr:protein BatD [Gammaproteobacteria bacterium]
MVNLAMARVQQSAWLVACALAMLVSTPLLAQVTATLSADVIVEFETVTLSVKDRSGSNAQPDFSVLSNDFEMSQVSTNSQISIVNGRYDSVKEWKLELTPKRTGRVNLPRIPFGNQATNALRLQVNPISQRERDYIRKTAYFETLVSHEEQYPQTAIYVTRRLLYTEQTRIPSISQQKQLDIENATVLSLGGRESLRERHDDTEYYVMQWRYVVFAEKSGEIHIPGEATRIGIYGNRFRPQVRTIVADAKTIKILPIPAEYPHDKPWFPASDVRLSQTYEPNDIASLVVGDALTRTIEVQAKNSYESALLPVELGSIGGMRVYPELASVETVLQNNEVWGTQSRTFNLIPFEHGNVVLPVFRLIWWDVDAKQVRESTLPALTLTTESPAQLPGMSVDRDASDERGMASDATSDLQPREASIWLYVFAVLALIGWLVVLLLLLREKLAWWRQNNQESAASVDYSAVRNALSQADPSMLRQAILRVTGRSTGANPVQVRRLLLSDPDGRELLQKLDQTIYHNEAIDLQFNFKYVKQIIDSISEKYIDNTNQNDVEALLT